MRYQAATNREDEQRRGQCPVDGILISQGAQQGLDLAGLPEQQLVDSATRLAKAFAFFPKGPITPCTLI